MPVLIIAVAEMAVFCHSKLSKCVDIAGVASSIFVTPTIFSIFTNSLAAGRSASVELCSAVSPVMHCTMSDLRFRYASTSELYL